MKFQIVIPNIPSKTPLIAPAAIYPVLFESGPVLLTPAATSGVRLGYAVMDALAERVLDAEEVPV